MIDFETVERAAMAHGYRLVADITTLAEYGKKEEVIVKKAEDIYKTLWIYAYAEVEHFILVTLDGASRIIQKRVITKGTVNQTFVHPRDIFRAAIKDNAAGIIVAHNHPSGTCAPSDMDRRLTQRIAEAGRLIGIDLLDHVILTEGGWYSFTEEGEL